MKKSGLHKKVFKLTILISVLLGSVFNSYADSFFWESPVEYTDKAKENRFPHSSPSQKNISNGMFFWEEIEKASQEINICYATSKDGLSFSSKSVLIDKISYSGEIPEIYSVASSKKGSVAVAVLSSSEEITIFTTTDTGKNFSKSVLSNNTGVPLIAPRIYELSDGGYMLFVTLAKEENFSLLYATSKDGKTWGQLKNFTPPEQSANVSTPFIPFLLSYNGADIVIYQARYAYGDQLSFQLFSTTTKDSGNKWTPPVMITTDQALLDDDKESFDRFNNQRPYLCEWNKTPYLVWERKGFSESNTSVMFAQLTKEGKITGLTEKLNENTNASRPELFTYGSSLFALWFDSLTGNETVYLKERNGGFWEDSSKLSPVGSTFPQAVISLGGKELSFIWQKKTGSGTSGLYALTKDHSAQTPVLEGISFTDNQRQNKDEVKLQIKSSYDSSGIQGFSYLWTQDPKAEPKEELNLISTSEKLTLSAIKDGKWFLKVKQKDYAGNWSPSKTITYVRDTTPPKTPKITPLDLDDYGASVTNSFTFSWEPNKDDEDIKGYTWTIEYLASIPDELATYSKHPMKLDEKTAEKTIESLLNNNETQADLSAEPPRYIRGNSNEKSVSYINRRNGVYVFSVAAIDTVGNIGKSAKYLVVANKYIPSTYITTINEESDQYGNQTIEIIGGGFTYDGSISTIYLDKDGKAPYDYVLTKQNGDFKTTSDSRITDITLRRLEAGEYKVGLIHTDRGLYFTSKNVLSIQDFGTVKTKTSFILENPWETFKKLTRHDTNISTIILSILAALMIIAIVASSRGLAGAAKEAHLIKAEVTALIEGGIMPNEYEYKPQGLKIKGFGLRMKLMLNSMLLVSLISVILIFTFRLILTSTEEKTLSKGLQDRTNVMLNSLESGAKVYLPLSSTSDNLSLQDTTNQISALNEALFATITGRPEDNSSTEMDFVWATTDDSIESKIDTQSYNFGTSKIIQEQFQFIIKDIAKLNETAAERLGDIPQKLSEVTKEATKLLGKNDSASIARRNELDEIRKQLNNRLDKILAETALEGSGSFPEYNGSTIDYDNTEYLFYRPVMYRHGSDQTYVHGVIFIGLSTESLVQEMNEAKANITRISIIMIALALAFALVSATLLSYVIIRPINRLALHVAMIRDTEDKEKLEGKLIQVKSKDEIGTLGDTVNEMTKGLVEAAKATKNLVLGKEIQTKFIPLDTDSKGNTLTTGGLKAKGVTFFSYYAGADELSGDYFDYKKIDESHFAVIKCDVSGHGVPAALIMVEVATLFLNYFQNWSMKNPRQGYNLTPVVSQINDLLESRGFKGRFAAFTLAILNTDTGECHFCNAGDNMIHIYDAKEKAKKIITLKETPAAGMFPTDLVEMKGGYTVSKLLLKKNDILFLYTDGIEEAQRLIRDEQGNTIKNSEDSDKQESLNEEFNPDRVKEIIESVYANTGFTLVKQDDHDEVKELNFDFKDMEISAESAIMALVSIEKIFRMYRNPSPKPQDKVKVDKKIDEFLRLHFKQYGTFCTQRSPVEGDDNYIWYHGVLEDPQYDDLTLIAVKKE